MNKEHYIRLYFEQQGIKEVKKYYNRKYNLEDVIKVLSMKKYTLTIELRISGSSVSRLLKELLPNKINKSQKACTYILRSLNKKHCSKCDIIKDITDFTKNKARADGLQSTCKQCFLGYERANPEIWRIAAIERKATVGKQTPKWGQEGIREFYKNTPKGYHVDHIIPLKGKQVSGLHILNNLQYLSAEDNLSKGNKFKLNDLQWVTPMRGDSE